MTSFLKKELYKCFAKINAFQLWLSCQIISSQSHRPAFRCSPMNESPVTYYWFPPCSVGRETALCAKNKFLFTRLVSENATMARTTKLGCYFFVIRRTWVAPPPRLNTSTFIVWIKIKYLLCILCIYMRAMVLNKSHFILTSYFTFFFLRVGHSEKVVRSQQPLSRVNGRALTHRCSSEGFCCESNNKRGPRAS